MFKPKDYVFSFVLFMVGIIGLFTGLYLSFNLKKILPAIIGVIFFFVIWTIMKKLEEDKRNRVRNDIRNRSNDFVEFSKPYVDGIKRERNFRKSLFN